MPLLPRQRRRLRTQIGPCHWNAAAVHIPQLGERAGTDVQVCRLAPSAPIDDREVDAPPLAARLVRPRGPNHQAAQRVRVRVAARLDVVEDEVRERDDVVGLGRGDAARAQARPVVCQLAGVGRAV